MLNAPFWNVPGGLWSQWTTENHRSVTGGIKVIRFFLLLAVGWMVLKSYRAILLEGASVLIWRCFQTHSEKLPFSLTVCTLYVAVCVLYTCSSSSPGEENLSCHLYWPWIHDMCAHKWQINKMFDLPLVFAGMEYRRGDQNSHFRRGKNNAADE